MTVPSGKRFGLGQSAGLSQVHGQSPPQQASFENLVFWGRLHLVDDYGGDEVDDDEDDDANDDEEDGDAIGGGVDDSMLCAPGAHSRAGS